MICFGWRRGAKGQRPTTTDQRRILAGELQQSSGNPLDGKVNWVSMRLACHRRPRQRRVQSQRPSKSSQSAATCASLGIYLGTKRTPESPAQSIALPLAFARLSSSSIISVIAAAAAGSRIVRRRARRRSTSARSSTADVIGNLAILRVTTAMIQHLTEMD